MTLAPAFFLAPGTFGAGGAYLAQATEDTGSKADPSGSQPGESAVLDGAEVARIRDQSIAAVERSKTDQGASSFLNLVPPQYRDWVIRQADEAHPTKGEGRPLEEFRDLMAKEWLAHREVFGILSGAANFLGLPDGSIISSSTPYALLALTKSGSLIGVTGPLEPKSSEKKRRYFYSRIGIRRDTRIPPEGTATLSRGVQIGRSICLEGAFEYSSAVIAAAQRMNAAPAEVGRAVVSMTQVGNSLGEVIWRPRDPL